MSVTHLYNIYLSNTEDNNKDQECFKIDREPKGDLNEHAELTSQCANNDPGYVLKLPDLVKKSYSYVKNRTFVTQLTLPGFLQWLTEHSYETVDMKHVAPLTRGFWIQYLSDETEFKKKN